MEWWTSWDGADVLRILCDAAQTGDLDTLHRAAAHGRTRLKPLLHASSHPRHHWAAGDYAWVDAVVHRQSDAAACLRKCGFPESAGAFVDAVEAVAARCAFPQLARTEEHAAFCALLMRIWTVRKFERKRMGNGVALGRLMKAAAWHKRAPLVRLRVALRRSEGESDEGEGGEGKP